MMETMPCKQQQEKIALPSRTSLLITIRSKSCFKKQQRAFTADLCISNMCGLSAKHWCILHHNIVTRMYNTSLELTQTCRMDTSLRSDPHKLRFRTFARFSLRVFCSTSSSDNTTIKTQKRKKQTVIANYH
jgi:hypothetical protein